MNLYAILLYTAFNVDEFLKFFIIFISFLIISYAFNYFTKKYLIKILEKTKNTINVEIVTIIHKPIAFFIVFVGLYFAIKSLSFLEKQQDLIDKVFFVFSVIVVSILISRIFDLFISKWLSVQKTFEHTPKIVHKIIAIVIYIIAFMVILDFFKVEITPLLTALGIGGLAIGLALQNTLSNFFAGLHLISDKPINVGQYVKLSDIGTEEISGTVYDIGWRSTRIKTRFDTFIVVPNSKLAETTIINYSLPRKEVVFTVDVGVDYKSNLKKVEKIAFNVASKIQKSVNGAVKDFVPKIRFEKFGESNINFKVYLQAENYLTKFFIMSEFIKELKSEFDKKGIEISWPIRKIYYMDKSK